jgi:hypothetical protein
VTFVADEVLPHTQERKLHPWAVLPERQRGKVIPLRTAPCPLEKA